MSSHPTPARFTAPQKLMKRTHHFINLTNGIELLSELVALGENLRGINFCRIQSSHCEACDFQAVLRELDHNLLIRLALGEPCIVYDCGSRGMMWPTLKKNINDEEALVEFDEAMVPRAVWWGLEWTRFALSEIWMLPYHPQDFHVDSIPEIAGSTQGAVDEEGGESPEREAWLRGYRVTALFKAQMKTLPKSLRKRLKYYRAIAAAAGTEEILVYGASRSTDLDGKKAVYAKALLDAFAVPEPEEGATGKEPGPNAIVSRESIVEVSSYHGTLERLRRELSMPPGVAIFDPSDYQYAGRAKGGVPGVR